jgi:cytochrome c biogenesis protein CcmG/thiol:disulfide interchange protein DsbE
MNEQLSPDAQEGRTMTTVQSTGQADVETLETGDATEVVPTSRKGALIGLGIVVLAVVTLFGFALAPRDQTAEAAVTGQQLSADPVGDLAPDFSGTLVDGSGTLALSSLRGKTVVVNFWASWCSTCKEEAQIVADVEKQWRDKGVVFVGVDSHDTKAGAATYVQTYGLGYASVQDPDSTVTAQYNVTGLPETFFLDTKGRIVAKYISAIDAVTLNSMIKQAVAAG